LKCGEEKIQVKELTGINIEPIIEKKCRGVNGEDVYRKRG
jgi:hypothetical protein